MNIIQTNSGGSRILIQSWPNEAPPIGYSEVAVGTDTSAMQTHGGFVNLTFTDDCVTAIEGNDAAYQAYLDSLPPPQPPAPPTEQEDLAALAIDHEYRLTLLELGVN